jgi:hypothetical protein
MAEIVTTDSPLLPERRRIERRSASRIGDLTLPEVRRIMITMLLSGVVLALFLWMVRTVVVASILGLIIGFYIRPAYLLIDRKIRRPTLSAILTLCAVIVPVLLVLAYSYSELSDVVGYAATHQDEIATKVDAAVQRIPFFTSDRAAAAIGNFIGTARPTGRAFR